jgi:hypothetical protein
VLYEPCKGPISSASPTIINYRKYKINPFLDQILIDQSIFIVKDIISLTSFHFFALLKITTEVSFVAFGLTDKGPISLLEAKPVLFKMIN